jgi:hypothetical protein
MRHAPLIVLAAIGLVAAFPAVADPVIITLECTGDVAGTFTFDLTGSTGATYDDDRTVDLSGVEISDSTIVFTQDDRKTIPDTTSSSGTSSRFRIDRQTNKIDRETYDYVDNKVTGESHATGQCKPAPTPHKAL